MAQFCIVDGCNKLGNRIIPWGKVCTAHVYQYHTYGGFYCLTSLSKIKKKLAVQGKYVRNRVLTEEQKAMRPSVLARQLGITRERARQILFELS